jgi:hypothetical protein
MTEADIERIVQEVVRRLLSLGMQVTAKPQSTLTIDDRVVSLTTLEGRLEGVQQLMVEPKAVVTPSVRDELRARKIELVRMSSGHGA